MTRDVGYLKRMTSALSGLVFRGVDFLEPLGDWSTFGMSSSACAVLLDKREMRDLFQIDLGGTEPFPTKLRHVSGKKTTMSVRKTAPAPAKRTKIYLQPRYWVITPPSTGPRLGPRMGPM